ncbi:hypothetical protein [Winogradskyella sp.]|uniref:hypothetical protein n=1 Tax=Winogradskyella sp. TaxID=1883156 RepID=UPI0025FB0330|nr:hypothetical protein [Winogradskyella sp.]
MKTVLVFLICGLSLCIIDKQNLNKTKHVECYYKSEINSPILIHDAVDGKIIDSLTLKSAMKESNRFEILESEYGWFKLKPYSVEQRNFDNFWVKSNGFFFKAKSIKEDVWMYLYDLPTKQSNRIHRLDNHQEVEVTEVSTLWVKVKFKIGNKRVEGWLPHENY